MGVWEIASCIYRDGWRFQYPIAMHNTWGLGVQKDKVGGVSEQRAQAGGRCVSDSSIT